MPLRNLYLMLALAGAVLPYAAFLPFLAAHGLDPSAFLAQLLATPVSRFFAADVMLCAVAVWVLAWREGVPRGVRGLWLPVLGTLMIGPSFGLPVYLYLRERTRGQGAG